jgi:N-alpha-acetyltransferase 15/16, NatA auxiliary subunit
VCFRCILDLFSITRDLADVFVCNRTESSLSTEQRSKILFLLDGFASSYPRASVPKRLALDVAEGEEFKSRVAAYIIAGLERGVPSLFVDIKGLYVNEDKLLAVEEVVKGLRRKLETGEGLSGEGESDWSIRLAKRILSHISIIVDVGSPPTALLWLYYFLALHFAHPSHPCPDYLQSLGLLSLAEAHTPTLPEISMARALIYKRAGDPEAAARAMEDARSLDGQDRFLNGKAGKYWLRAGDVTRASETFGMFTKVGDVSAYAFKDWALKPGLFTNAEGCHVARKRSHRHAVHVVPSRRGGCVQASWKIGKGPQAI